ncbi:MAG: glucose 1-dehydrogenase [Alphaproteobacteria bacterium]|nr:glucose 1-dehydrogenase [Alphaproteobacteria bacterium]
MEIHKQVAIVTGAAKGIGASISRALAAAGARVVCADIDGKAAGNIAKELGGDCMPLTVDVGDVESIETMLDQTMEQFGQLNTIVNNAGVTRSAYIMDLTETDWDRIHQVNARGVFFCLQGAARRMIEGDGGRIINIASIAGRGYAGTSNAAYAASKGAVISLTKTAAQQLAKHDITVNAICPGVTRTELLEKIFTTIEESQGISKAEAEARAARPIPLQRINEPEDIAAMAIFLASPGARNITGQAYNVDGGLITS